MSTAINDIMERASQALADMDYLACEALCLEALSQAKQDRDWAMVARVLLPLQESRRQRRLTAADAGVRTEPGDLRDGCIVLTHPHTRDQARDLQHQAQAQQRCVEVLYVDNPPEAGSWTVRAFEGPDAHCTRPAPDGEPDVAWYLQASEALGDAAIAQVDAPPGSVERFDALEQRLAVVVDHEKLHQRLADAAREIANSC